MADESTRWSNKPWQSGSRGSQIKDVKQQGRAASFHVARPQGESHSQLPPVKAEDADPPQKPRSATYGEHLEANVRALAAELQSAPSTFRLRPYGRGDSELGRD